MTKTKARPGALGTQTQEAAQGGRPGAAGVRWGMAMGTQQPACELHPTAPRPWGLCTDLLSLTRRSGIPSTAVRPQGLALPGSVHPQAPECPRRSGALDLKETAQYNLPVRDPSGCGPGGAAFPWGPGGIPGQGQERPHRVGAAGPKASEQVSTWTGAGDLVGLARPYGTSRPAGEAGRPLGQDLAGTGLYRSVPRSTPPPGASQLPRIPKAGD